MKRILATIALCFSLVTIAVAQNVQLINDLGIHADELEIVQTHIGEKVDDFQRYLQDLAGRGNMSHKAKMDRYALTIELFIGKGEPYIVREPYYDGYRETMHEAVKMTTINSTYRQIRTSYPMTDYLSNLIKRSEDPNYRYKQVLIEAADAVRVDNFSKAEGEGHYIATAHILQHFVGYGKDGVRVQYEDYTAKTITVYIDKVEIDTPEGINYYWEIQLGDVDCDDIW